MSHSLCKIWIHAIWGTKERIPLIESKIEKPLYDCMYGEFIKVNSPARIINGMPDHVHSLFLLNTQKCLADIIKQVKGSSSHHVNLNDLIPSKFAWQTGYAAYSVSESMLEKTFLYIQHQKENHKTKSFQEEYEEFLKFHGYSGGE